MTLMRHALLLLAAIVLAGCGEKWQAMEFPEHDFAATLPMPVNSQPKAGGVMHYWAHGGKAQFQVLRAPAAEGMGSTLSEADALQIVYDELAADKRPQSPPRMGKFQGRYSALEFNLAGRNAEGIDAEMKGRILIVGTNVIVASALWPSNDKTSSQNADRFLESFRILQ